MTKRGRPVAELTTVVQKPKTLRGLLKGQIRERDDIVGPLDIK